MSSGLVRIEGLDEARDSVRRLAMLRGARLGLAAAATHLKGQFATYPEKSRPSRASVYGSTFKSAAQRRFIFAAIKRGDIPYRRGLSNKSETLGRRWATEERRGGLEQVIGNNASYVAYVQGEKQSLYMKAVGWQKVEDIAAREAGTVNEIVNFYVRRDVDGR